MDPVGGEGENGNIKLLSAKLEEKEERTKEAPLEELPQNQPVDITIVFQNLKSSPIHDKDYNFGFGKTFSKCVEGRGEEKGISYSRQGKNQDLFKGWHRPFGGLRRLFEFRCSLWL